MPQTTIIDPLQYDGDPSEVAQFATNQLSVALDRLQKLATATEAVVRSDLMQEALELPHSELIVEISGGEVAAPDAPFEYWLQSREAELCRRINTGIDRIRREADVLAKARAGA